MYCQLPVLLNYGVYSLDIFGLFYRNHAQTPTPQEQQGKFPDPLRNSSKNVILPDIIMPWLQFNI